ncbi:MAG: hypothetical protein KDD58_16025, partial [Bdellovibrionales bacterium]|nr:hypothetical protein [Bdellovibrionales bacterium]
MKNLKRIAWTFLAIILTLSLTVWIVNYSDEPLSQEFLSIQQSRTTNFPPDYIEAYKYALGFRAPKDVNPLIFGNTYYNHIKVSQQTNGIELPEDIKKTKNQEIKFLTTPPYCKIFPCTKEEVNSYLKKQSSNTEIVNLLKERFNQILNYGGLAIDLEPDMLSHSYRVTDLLNGYRHLIYDYSIDFSKGNIIGTVKGLLKIKKFFRNSLEYPNSLLASFISLTIINEINEALINISDSNIEAKNFLTKTSSEEKNKPINFDQLITLTTNDEMISIKNIIKSINTFEVFSFTNLGLETKLNPLTQVFYKNSSWLVEILLKKNETINTLIENITTARNDRCIITNSNCEWNKNSSSIFNQLRNPLGKYL